MVLCFVPSKMGLLREFSANESACHFRRHGFDPGLGRSAGEGNDNPLKYSCLENPISRGSWWAKVHGAARVGHYFTTKPKT